MRYAALALRIIATLAAAASDALEGRARGVGPTLRQVRDFALDIGAVDAEADAALARKFPQQG